MTPTVYLIILIAFGGLTGDVRYEQKIRTMYDCEIASQSINTTPGKFYRYEEDFTYNKITSWCVKSYPCQSSICGMGPRIY